MDQMEYQSESQKAEEKAEQEAPFSLAPALYTPFNGLDSDSENDGREPSYAEILTKQIKNLTAQQDIVRKNMLFLTQQRAQQLFAKAQEDMRNFEGPEDVHPKLPAGLSYVGPEDATGEEYEYKFKAKSPTNERDDDGDIQMRGQTRALIRNELAGDVAKLIEQSASEMGRYDIHAAEVLKPYQEELKRIRGNLANILEGAKAGGQSSEIVTPMDHFA